MHFLEIFGFLLQALKSCYDDVIEILRQRFWDRCLIERKHLSKLCRVPKVKSASGVHGLRMMFDRVKNGVRIFGALGISSTSYASMVAEMVSSLPSEMMFEYHRLGRYGTALNGTLAEVGTVASRDDQWWTTAPDSAASGELTKVLNHLRVEIESFPA